MGVYRMTPDQLKTLVGDITLFQALIWTFAAITPPAPDYGELGEKISGLSSLIQKLIDLLKSIFNL